MPSSGNNFTVTALIYKGDAPNGLHSQPTMWIYRYQRCLVRCFYISAHVEETEETFEEDVIYEMTSEVSFQGLKFLLLLQVKIFNTEK